MAQRLLVRALIVALAIVHATTSAAQSDRSRLIGSVIDTSGGALPGVTVTLYGSAIAPATTFTDGSGRYLLPWVPPGTYNVTFELSGFDTRRVTGLVLAAGQTVVLDQQMPLAALSETVEVRAPAPPPPPPRRPTPPPRPKVKPTQELLASVCGPRQSPDFSLARGRIVSHRDDPRRELLSSGDVLRIDSGSNQGLEAGQNFVIRRRFTNADTDWVGAARTLTPLGEQTVGLLEIMEVNASTAVARVVYACGEILAGDTIEPYVAQPARVTVSDGTPRYDDPARIAFGEDDRTAAMAGQMMVIDRGVMQGVQRGQQLTIFRRSHADGATPIAIGDGIIISVRPDSATIRIDRASDAIYVGDLIALHR